MEANTLERVGCGGALMRRGALVLSLLMAGCLRFGPAAGMSSTGIKDLRSCNTETQACALIPDFVSDKVLHKQVYEGARLAAAFARKADHGTGWQGRHSKGRRD